MGLFAALNRMWGRNGSQALIDDEPAAGASSKAAPGVDMLRPHRHALALEPRIMFDGAAASAVDQHHGGDTTRPPEASGTDRSATPGTQATGVTAREPSATAEAAPAAVAPPPAAAPQHLLVIDSRVEQREQLQAQIGPDVKVLVVDTAQDGLAAISAALAQMGQVDSIQILSHGASGQFTLGSVTVSADNVDRLGAELQGWQSHLTADADIQLYGCNVGAGAAGQTLVNELARWTGADVGASSDATGAAAEGGNWVLETRAGDIDKALVLSAGTLAGFDGLLADAEPTVALSADGDSVLLGDTFTVTASFTNPSTQVGYAPYIDVFVPTTGKDGAGAEVDDGITFVSATFEGQSIVSYVLTFDANGQATHPLAKDSSGNALVINAADYGMRAGDQFVVLQLPNASIINGQPPVNIVLTFQLSSLADTTLTDGAPDLTIRARGGFQFGNTSADDPTVDPTLIEAGPLHEFTVHPTMVELTQTANVPDGETVSGPNYPRSITVTASTASDQQLRDVVIEQDLPDSIVVTSIVPGAGGEVTSITLHDGTVITGAGAINDALAAGAYLSHYVVTYATLTGSVDTTVNFYVPEVDANGAPVLDPTTGAPRTVNIAAPDASATWTPLDTRDIPIDGATLSGSGDPTNFVVKSIVVYKEATVTNDVGAQGPSPGDTLTYRLEVDISDYFAFGTSLLNQGSLVITDDASNGQTVVPGSGVFTVTMNGQTLNLAIEPQAVVNADGSTSMQLDLAKTLRDNGQALAALVGDLAFDQAIAGATIGVISYQTVISQDYTGDFPHSPINEGDSVGNNATVTGTVLVDPVNTGGTATDSDSATVDIPVSGVEIIVATVNGQPAPPDVELRPGDVVTFRISYDLLTGDYESFTLSAYMPLPLFDVTEFTGANGTGVNQWYTGPNHTITDTVEGVSTEVNGNYIVFDFGDHSSPFTEGSRVEIMFTMVVGDTPFADQRKVTVIAQSDQLTTLDGEHLVSEDAAVISSIAEPVLNISHGVVSSSAGTVSGAGDNGWAPPGDGGTPFTAPVTDIADVNGDVTGIDGADTLRMATAIENSGGGGAYDVVTQVDLPAGLSFVGGSLGSTLRVFRGDGTELVAGTDYTVSGNVVTFLDPAGSASLLAGRPGTDADNNGQNVVILLYDVQVASDIAASSTLESTALITNYAAINDGTDFTPVDLTERAGEQIAAPSIAKYYADGTLDATDSSSASTSGADLVVGETMLYDIVVTLPEGSATNLRIDDLIPPGLALDTSFNNGQGYQIITIAGAGGSGALTADFGGTLQGGTPEGVGGTIGQDGVDGRITFTASTNNADNNTGNNSFVIRVRLVASNSIDNQDGRVLNNSAQITYTDPDGDVAGGTTPVDRTVALDSGTPPVTVREPVLTLVQTTANNGGPAGVDEGNTVTYTIVISNNSGYGAYDISFSDTFPTTQLTGLVLGEPTVAGGVNFNGGPGFVLEGGVLRTADGANIDIAPGGSITLVVTGTVTAQAVNFQSIDNTASVQWTSMNESVPVPADAGGERTGVQGVLNGGTLNDYRLDSSSQVRVLAGVILSRIGGMPDTPSADNGTTTDGDVEQVAVGEIVRYRVASAIGQGQTNDYQVQVTLDPGLTYQRDDTIRIAIVSNGGVTVGFADLAVGALFVDGDRSNPIAQPIPVDLSNGPTAVMNLAYVVESVDDQGRTVLTFRLGDVINNESDEDLEGVVIEFNARVDNIPDNLKGTALGVTAAFVNADGLVGASDSVTETVVEPQFSGLVKQVDSFTPNDSGTTSTADVSVSFTQSGDATAYDVRLDDSFTGVDSYTLTSITITDAAGNSQTLLPADFAAAGITDNSDGTGIHLAVDRIDPGTRVVVNYSVTVDVNTAYASTDAVLTWSSLPETFTDWGGTPVGTDADTDGERDGSGAGPNTYVLREGAGLGLVSGTLWDDSFSADGTVAPQGGELLLADQTVTLTWAGVDGTFGTGDDATFTTVTDSAGYFHFSALAAGSYRIDAPAAVTLDQPTGQMRVRIDTDDATLGQVVAAVGEGLSNDASFGYVQLNDAPVNTVPGTQTGDEDTLLHLEPITVADVDLDQNGPGVLDVTLTVGQGVLDFEADLPDGLVVGGRGTGTLTLSGSAADINTVLATLTYLGRANYNGNDTLTITTADRGSFGDADGDGIPGENAEDQLQDQDTVAIVLRPVNDIPEGVDDVAYALEAGGAANGTPGIDPAGNLLDNDIDVDKDTSTNPSGDELHLVSVTSTGTNDTANPTGTAEFAIVGTYGTLYVRANGSARYVVDNANAEVQALRLESDTLVEIFTYTLADRAGAQALNPATLTVTIHGANDTPVGVDDQGAALEAGGVGNNVPGNPATGNVLTNDTDVDGGPDEDVPDYGETKTVTGVRSIPKDQAGELGAHSAPIDGLYGTLTLNADGSYTYVVDDDNPAVQALSTGQTLTEVFSYQVTDAGNPDGTGRLSALANLTIIINGAFDNPVASDDLAQAQAQGFEADGVTPMGPEINPSGNVITDASRPDGDPTPGTGVDTDIDTVDEAAGALTVTAARTGQESDVVGTLMPVNSAITLVGAYGTLTLNADGSYSYDVDSTNQAVIDLALGQQLQDFFTYQITDQGGLTDVAQLQINISGANDAPVAQNVNVVAVEQGGVDNGTPGIDPDGDVTVNSVDPDGDPLSVIEIRTGAEGDAGGTTGDIGQALAGTYGSLTMNEDGTFSYVLDNDNPLVQALRTPLDSLTERFTYTLSDGKGGTDTAEVVIRIVGRNDNPVAADDDGTITEAGGANNNIPSVDATGNVLANDTDVDGGASDGGTVPDYGETSTVTTVGLGSEAAPGADGTVGTELRGTYGWLTLRADGSYSYRLDNSMPEVEALRLSTDTLADEFHYTVADQLGATDVATLRITIAGRNDNPVAANDVGEAVEAGGVGNDIPGSPATGNVLANDTDVDGGASDPVDYGETAAVRDFSQGTRTGTPGTAFAAQYGTLELAADGSYTYTVDDANATVQALRPGQTLTEVFSYTMVDAAGAISTATLTITIRGADDAPVAADDTAIAVEAGGVDNGTPGTDPAGNVLANDTDVDNPGISLSVSAVRTGAEAGSGTAGTIGAGLAGAYGTLTLNANGSYTYVVDNGNAAVQALRRSGDTLQDVFTYTVTDPNGLVDTAQLTVTIRGANDNPVAADDAAVAIEAGGFDNQTPGTDPSGNVLDNDTDVDQFDETKAVRGFLQGANLGTLGAAFTAQYGTLVLNADGSWSYAVDNDNAAVQALRTDTDVLTEVFTYTMQDALGATSTATLTITIHGRNDNPVAVDDTARAKEQGGTFNDEPGIDPSGNVLANDIDPDAGDTHVVSGIRTGAEADGGDFSAVLGSTVIEGSYGTLTIAADGSYTYVVNNTLEAVQRLREHDSLTDVFSYRTRDANLAEDIAQLTVTIDGAWDAPVARDDADAASAGTVRDPSLGIDAVGNVLPNDTDVDIPDTKTVTGIGVGPEAASPALEPVGATTYQIDGLYGTLFINADGSYTYQVDRFNPIVQQLPEGEHLDEYFTYQVSDAGGLTDRAQLYIEVHGINNPPLVVPDIGNAVEAGGLNNGTPGVDPQGNVLANDIDVDGDTLVVSGIRTGTVEGSGTDGTVGQVLRGQWGDLVIHEDGSWTYVVDNDLPEVQALRVSGQTLVDNFTYTARDPLGETDTGLLHIVIDGRNDTPIAQDDTAEALEAGGIANGTPGQDATGNVLDNDNDVDGVAYGETERVQSYASATGAQGEAGSTVAGLYGALVINADGTYRYVIDNDNPAVQALRTSGETLTETFSYVMRDEAGAVSQANLVIVVRGANDNPVARDDSNVATDQVVAPQATGNVLPNDSDVDGGDALHVGAIRTGPEAGSGTAGTMGQPLAGRYGTLVINADGSYTYSIDMTNPEVLAAAGFGQVLQDVFTYTLVDRAGATDLAELVIHLDISAPRIDSGNPEYFGRERLWPEPPTLDMQVEPGLFVQPVVRQSAIQQYADQAAADGTEIGLVLDRGLVEPPTSLTYGLNAVAGEFVGEVVRNNALAAQLELARLLGRHGRVSLTADGLLGDPSLFSSSAPSLTQGPAQRQVPDREGGGQRSPLAQARATIRVADAPPAEDGPAHTDALAIAPAHDRLALAEPLPMTTAAGFSEQLRRAAAQLHSHFLQ